MVLTGMTVSATKVIGGKTAKRRSKGNSKEVDLEYFVSHVFLKPLVIGKEQKLGKSVLVHNINVRGRKTYMMRSVNISQKIPLFLALSAFQYHLRQSRIKKKKNSRQLAKPVNFTMNDCVPE